MAGPGRKRETTDDELLREILMHPEPVVTAKEIAERVNMTNAGVNKRLPQLVDDNLVVKKVVGANAAIYWLTEKGKRRVGEA